MCMYVCVHVYMYIRISHKIQWQNVFVSLHLHFRFSFFGFFFVHALLTNIIILLDLCLNELCQARVNIINNNLAVYRSLICLFLCAYDGVSSKFACELRKARQDETMTKHLEHVKIIQKKNEARLKEFFAIAMLSTHDCRVQGLLWCGLSISAVFLSTFSFRYIFVVLYIYISINSPASQSCRIIYSRIYET